MEEKKAKMLKFIMGKGHQPSAERLRVQKELFGFSKFVKHGFPNKPSAMGWDPELKIMAIGTKHGLFRVYGRPGVEFYGQHDTEKSVNDILFLPGQGRVITLTEDNVLHLWEINGSSMQVKCSVGMDGRLKQISSLCLDGERQKVLLGTEGGNIYRLDLARFKIDDTIIFQDVVMQSSPSEDFKVNPGAVESVLIHPAEPAKILIGYARGLVVLWDRDAAKAENTFAANQQLEALAWRNDGSQFVSAHNDGSFVIWSTTGTEPLEPPNTPYGPYPCKAITKIKWAHDSGTAWTVFSGGMPRASYGDKFTVTVMKGDERHTVFDLTSKVIDFELLTEGSGQPTALIILSEEELAVVDLTADGSWPVVHDLPYLNPIHASPITCVAHVAGVEQGIFNDIVAAGRATSKVSAREWPINGGACAAYEAAKAGRSILITGHEDGSVKFWNCEGVALSLLATAKTASLFVGDDLDRPRDDDEDEDEDDEWPPFKKLGQFDPFSDDQLLAVRKVAFCPTTGRLIVGGTAGQVVVCSLNGSERAVELDVIRTDLVTEKEGFVWKGHNALVAKVGKINLAAGFQPEAVLQISPPASINSLVISSEYGLVAAGTAHGLVVIDSLQTSVVLSKCTLNAQDIANADDNPMSRRKSLKKSLRESFRRLRKGRSQRQVDKKKANSTTSDPIKRELPRAESPDARPIERAVEARTGSEDGLGSMVRCLHFAQTYIASAQTSSATLWAGTNSGQIMVFVLTIPAGKKRDTDRVAGQLGKEIQLRHKAPVISIQVVDGSGAPLSGPQNPDNALSANEGHRVVISSEEQFKVFTLPALKPCGKYKLTAHEGARIRRTCFTRFASEADPAYAENCLTCLTNQGDLAIHSLPDLRRQVLQTNCIKKEDVIAISTFVFAPDGQAYFLASSSELSRVSLAAAIRTEAKGTLDIKAGARLEMGEEKAAKKKAADPEPSVARQNLLNEQQQLAQGEKTPAVNGEKSGAASPTMDPHNETTVSEISADITLDSVKDHTVTQQQLLEASMVSSSSRTMITTDSSTSAKVVTKTEEESGTKSTADPVNSQPADVNALSESMESAAINEPIEESEVLAGESTKTNDSAAEEKDNEENEERVTCVDEVKLDEAPLASLESTTEFQSM